MVFCLLHMLVVKQVSLGAVVVKPLCCFALCSPSLSPAQLLLLDEQLFETCGFFWGFIVYLFIYLFYNFVVCKK